MIGCNDNTFPQTMISFVFVLNLWQTLPFIDCLRIIVLSLFKLIVIKYNIIWDQLSEN